MRAQLAITSTMAMDRKSQLVAAFDLTANGYIFSAEDNLTISPSLLAGHLDLVDEARSANDTL